jgi:parallel beta-helix repeat protein
MWMSAFYYVITIVPDTVGGATLHVGGIGPGNFTTIQSAIDAANAGDTVYVYNGIYTEHLLIDRTISLVGENRSSTTIDGSGMGKVVNVSADWVNVSGFTITNSGPDSYDAGIEMFSVQNCYIANNNISNNYLGVRLISSEWNVLADNTASSNSRYVVNLFRSANNSIINNTVYYGRSIRLENSNNNTLANNTLWTSVDLLYSDSNKIHSNAIMGHRGIELRFSSSYNTISSNTIVNSDKGIYLTDNNTVISNHISNSLGWGIEIKGYNNNIISNTLVDNGVGEGIYVHGSGYNTIVGNVMSGNGIFIKGNLEGWNTHIIDSSNTVNGKPVHYWKNATGGTPPLDAGVIILANCSGVVVENRTFSYTGEGIQVGHSSNNTIVNNTLHTSTWSPLYMQFSSNNTIISNTFFNNELGMLLEFSYDNTIIYNNFTDSDTGILFLDSERNRILNNNMSGVYIGMNLLFGNKNNTIANNTVFSSRFGIRLYWKYESNTIFNNTVSTSEGIGIFVHGCDEPMAHPYICSDRTIIANNTVFSSRFGILLSWSNINTIINNKVFGNEQVGISVGSSFNYTLAGNDVSNNGNGISLHSSGSGSIFNNTVSSNVWDGVQLGGTYSHDISGNTISSNRRGLSLSDSYGTLIFHNNFINNVDQAYDDHGNENAWDHDYPVGGNYWNDYNGLDWFHGPNQDQLGSDGIGDTPYDIDTDSLDRYPLTDPWGIVVPGPPAVLDAALSGPGLKNLNIKWELSPDDGGGWMSVVGYRIYRNRTYHPGGLGYQLIATIPNGTTEFSDNLVGEGDPNNYFYYICSIDLTNNTKCAINQAAKFTHPLFKGPSLVSIPLIQSNESIKTVLQTVAYNDAWSYNPMNKEWKSFARSKPYDGTLEYVNHAEGIWVNVTDDSNLTVAGVVPMVTTINLQAGWNLVGFPSFDDSYTVANLKAVIAADRVEGFDGAAPPYFLRAMTNGDLLQAGSGYWINTASDATWIVANS